MAGTVGMMARAARSYWTAGLPVERFAYAVGALVVASGIVHLGVFAVDGGAWQGPVSWRKPVTFGLSFGITAITVTWCTTFLSVGPWVRRAVLVPLAVATAVEVALVSLQAWRGVPSHFNITTDFDNAVFNAMGVSVGVIGAAVVVVTVLACARLQAPPSMALAVRAGLGLLLVAQVVGVRMIVNGLILAPDPAAYAAGGTLKLPHAVTIHAVQVLPGLAWLLSFAAISELRRVRLVAVALAGHTGLAAVAIATAFPRARAGGAGVSLAVLGVVSVALLAGAMVAGLRATLRLPAPDAGLGRTAAGSEAVGPVRAG